MPRLKNKRRFGRKRDQRRALFSSLAKSLIIHGKIKTTEAKAKELRPYIEKLVTKAKVNTIHNRRILAGRLSDKAAEKLIKEIAPKYESFEKGGYTRIVKMGPRQEDGARIAIIEFV